MRGHNSTIKLKQKACIRCGKKCVWFSKKRCQECARIEDTLAKDFEENVEEEDLSGLIQDADALVSRYIRMAAKNKEGLIKCFTCTSVLPMSEMDCGHYIPRANLFLRHDLKNLRPQCHTCNRHKYGMAAVFAQNLEKESPGVVDWLVEESRIVHHVGREELRAIISEMIEKLNKIKP